MTLELDMPIQPNGGAYEKNLRPILSGCLSAGNVLSLLWVKDVHGYRYDFSAPDKLRSLVRLVHKETYENLYDDRPGGCCRGYGL